MDAKNWRGYVFSREFNGNFVPQRVQNLVIRSYCEKNRNTFLLSVTEYYMPGTYLILKALLDEPEGFDAVIFYTTHFLPDSFVERQFIYDKIIKNGKELHFALEELVIHDVLSAQAMEDIIMVRKISQQAYIPTDL